MKDGALKKTAFILSLALNLLLAAGLITTAIFYTNYKHRIKPTANQETIVAESPPPAKEETIPVAAIKESASVYGATTEFLQNIFPDKIVYKTEDGIVYAPIDDTIPKNSYDFKKLENVDGELQYMENGVPAAKKGIDVSKYQGSIDWNKVKADGIDYAIIRLGYRGYDTGALMLDETYKKNIKNATKAGMKVGVYFFSQAITIAEAEEEANMIIEAVEGYDLAYPVIFDTEQIAEKTARANQLTMDERTDIAIAFCEKIKSAGYKPMIYANVRWFVGELDLKRLTQYDKWFAQYYKTPFFPYEFQMWQYTAKGKVDGIKGDVDMNLCFKDYSAE